VCACMCVCVCVRVCVVGFNLLKTHVYCITFYDKWLGFFWGKNNDFVGLFWKRAQSIIFDSIHSCVCVCVCAYVCLHVCA